MTKVTKLFPADDPDTVLEAAKGKMKDVVIFGWDENEELYVAASTNMKRKDVNWLIDKAKLVVLDIPTMSDLDG